MSDGLTRKSPRRGDQGQWWQERLAGLLRDYEAQGRCAGEQTYPAHKNLGWTRDRRGAYFRGIYTGQGKGVPDLNARLGGAARAWLAEAKEFFGDAWPYADLEEEQAKRLDDALKLGAGAYIFVRSVNHKRAWLLPWRLLRDRWWSWATRAGRAPRGTASLTPAQLEGLALYQHDPGARDFDFLDALIADMEATRVRI